MAELYVLLECATREQSGEASTIFSRFATWNDTSHAGATETETIYHLRQANVASILGWCWAAVELHTIIRFQVQEIVASPAEATRVVSITQNNGNMALAYTMSLNDDVARLVSSPGSSHVRQAPREVIEDTLRTTWSEALFVTPDEMFALLARCACGKPSAQITSALCAECAEELRGRATGNEWNDDQAAMWADYVGTRMGQKLDLQSMIASL